jgi:hypothetical protein
LKPEQKDILAHLLDGSDCFGILPTGFGKSLNFTLFPLLKDQAENVSFPLRCQQIKNSLIFYAGFILF